MKKQIALCIGNNDYMFPCLPKLNCAVNDAIALAEKLKQLNFDVIAYKNLKRHEIYTAVEKFEEQLPKYDVALFYFAGHGFECMGKNLLMPIDAQDGDRGFREWTALDLDNVLNALNGKNIDNSLQTKIVILDACRQNLEGRGTAVRGFAPILAPSGTIIAFSTSPGQLAKENGSHGYYTQALLECIDIPRIPVENMFKHVREKLVATSRGEQISWEHTSLMGNFYFNEDRIDAFAFYSVEALADANYVIKKSSLIGQIIEELKSHEWARQNSAIDKIYSIDFASASPNDLFVLGRNIYQAASGNAWKAQNYIKAFAQNRTIISDAKAHILCGMAYEIYFDKNDKLRDSFKTNCYLEILNLLNIEEYQKSKYFIVGKLSTITEKPVYLPSSEDRIEIDLICKEDGIRTDGGTLIKIEKIYLHGKNIFYHEESTDAYDENAHYCWGHTVNTHTLHLNLAKELAAPPDMLTISYGPFDKDFYYFEWPTFLNLRLSPKTADI